MEELRKRCPWDREQTHESLKKYLIEEAYEVLEAIESGSDERLKEELGDLLLQPVFHAQIAKERSAFTIEDVIHSLVILEGIPKHLPALMRSQKLQEKAAQVGFTFGSADRVFEKIEEELRELKSSVREGSREGMEHELGDLLTAVVELARIFGLDAEAALQRANDRFLKRFSLVEKKARSRGKELKDMTEPPTG